MRTFKVHKTIIFYAQKITEKNMKKESNKQRDIILLRNKKLASNFVASRLSQDKQEDDSPNKNPIIN